MWVSARTARCVPRARTGHLMSRAGASGSSANCRALTVACLNTPVSNPFAGLITDPNSTIGSSFPQIQYYQLLRPFPQFTGLSTEPQLIANSFFFDVTATAEKK